MTSNTIKIKTVKMTIKENGFYAAIATGIDKKKYQYACSITPENAIQFREMVISQGEINTLTWFAA